jgi:tryptophanyl-tRNA synthetase
MPRVFSGIKPTGEMQLGNFLGAIRHWVDGQPAAGSDAARNHEAIFCVVDLHAMTVPWDPAELERLTRHVATLLMASGLDEDRSLLFVQSQVRAHAELTWMLNGVATFGELRRMTQFKDKSEHQESLSVGYFDYPVLMAADILLYDTNEVPVGDDQRQHVELTRDIAVRFNHRFGDTFVIPTATFPKIAARVMDLQQPDKKMSKTDDSPMGCVLVLDPPKTIEKKFKSAVTASRTSSRSTRPSPAKPSPTSSVNSKASSTGRSRPRSPTRWFRASSRCRNGTQSWPTIRARSIAASRLARPRPRKSPKACSTARHAPSASSAGCVCEPQLLWLRDAPLVRT